MQQDSTGSAAVSQSSGASPVIQEISFAQRCWLAALFAGLFAANLLTRQSWEIDDALIYQNFVRNALAGEGLAYAPGVFVEGFSSPLWLIMITVADWLTPLDGYATARLLGAACGAGSCALLALMPLPRRYFWMLLIAGVMLALQPSSLWIASTGMETPLVALLLAAAAVAMMRGQRLTVAAIAGLIAIVRPEAPMYSVLLCGWLLQDHLRRHGSLADLARLGLLAAAPGLIWQGYRLFYYHAWVANAAYAKLGVSAIILNENTGAGYLIDSFRQIPGPWLLALTGTIPAIRCLVRSPEHARDYPTAIMFMMIFLGVQFAIAVKGDWVPGSRFFVPLIPVMVMLALRQWHHLEGQWRHVPVGIVIIALALTLKLQVADYYSVVHHRAEWPPRAAELWAPQKATTSQHYFAFFMMRYTVPGDTVAHFDVGQSGYFVNDVKILDQFGLVSRYESEYLHKRHTSDEMLQHFRDVSPSVVFVLRDRVTHQPAMRIAQAFAPELELNYRIESKALWWGNNALYVYVRKDALDRTTDEQRLTRLEQQSPGLIFRRDTMLARLVGKRPS